MIVGRGGFDTVGGFRKEMPPECVRYELEQGEDPGGARLGGGGGGGAVEEEGEEALAEGVACFVEAVGGGVSISELMFIIRGREDLKNIVRGGCMYRLSRSCIPVTLFCAYPTISANKYAKLALLSSAVRVRLRFRS